MVKEKIMNDDLLDRIDAINTLYAETTALLDLMMSTNGDVGIQSIKTASEMCLGMVDEIKAEVDKIYKTLETSDDDLK